jgi:LEA14-like dessication related protein
MEKYFPPLPAILLLTGLLGLTTACATKTPPEAAPAPALPVLSLGLDRIEAANPDAITLFFLLNAENSHPSAVDISLGGWELSLNGRAVEQGAALTMETAVVGAFSAGTFPARIRLDAAALSLPEPPDFTEYDAGITLELSLGFHNGDTLRMPVSVQAVFPRIQTPVFTISSIAVMQAELINTRFRVSLRIDNPNNFPVELASFSYELYGGGRYWAEGKETKVMQIPPRGSLAKDLFLLMNFMNMKREVLDQVIALRAVRYRFAGDVVVGTGVEYLPRFNMHFDRTGESPVVQ